MSIFCSIAFSSYWLLNRFSYATYLGTLCYYFLTIYAFWLRFTWDVLLFLAFSLPILLFWLRWLSFFEVWRRHLFLPLISFSFKTNCFPAFLFSFRFIISVWLVSFFVFTIFWVFEETIALSFTLIFVFRLGYRLFLVFIFPLFCGVVEGQASLA